MNTILNADNLLLAVSEQFLVNAQNAGNVVILVAALVACAVSIYSLVFVLIRWRSPQRRVYVKRLIVSILAVPCLFGIQHVLLWWVFLPAMDREIMSQRAARRASQNAETALVHVDDVAPNFTLTDVDGSTFAMANAKGKVVLINFFAPWCYPCKEELPHIEEIWAEYRGAKNFQLLVIGREETMESVRDFRSKQGFSFPIAPDPDRSVYSLFAKELIPRTIVISAGGRVVYSQIGFDESDLEELRSVLKQQIEVATGG